MLADLGDVATDAHQAAIEAGKIGRHMAAKRLDQDADPDELLADVVVEIEADPLPLLLADRRLPLRESAQIELPTAKFLDGHPQRCLSALAIDAERKDVGGGGECREHLGPKRAAGEHADDAEYVLPEQDRIARECDHARSCGPLLVVHARIADHGVGEVWSAFLRDKPDLERADRNAAVRTVEMRIEARARLELERLPLAHQPEAGEGSTEMNHHRLGAVL